jgi:hypothetical protein
MSNEVCRINRRDAMRAAGMAALAVTAGSLPLPWAGAAAAPPRNVLVFLQTSKLAGVNAQTLTELGSSIAGAVGASGISLNVINEGSKFTAGLMSGFDLVVFLSVGDLTLQGDGAISPAAKQAFLLAVSKGKGFIATYCGQPAGTVATAAQVVADAKLIGEGLATTILPGQSGSLHLADHAVHVKGAAIGKTPMPLRVVCVNAKDGTGKSKTRPVLALLLSNGGSLLKQTLLHAHA